jgi:hypothetical protein
MVKPISLRNATIAKAHATLIRAGRGEELRQIRAAAALRQARATVAQAEERKRLKRIAALAAQKAVIAVKQAQNEVAYFKATISAQRRTSGSQTIAPAGPNPPSNQVPLGR